VAAEKEATIVVKKIKKGGHGHHGGAWKVAYADFVTAMMAFFMVMWLMGSDDATKAAIAHYFNHPNTPYEAGRDPSSETTSPLGERKGDGDTVLKGQAGATPEDLSRQPTPKVDDSLSTEKDLKNQVQSELDTLAYGVDLSFDTLKFSISEDELFDQEQTALKPSAALVLEKVGTILKRYPGYLTVEGHLEASDQSPGGVSAFEFTLARAVSVMNFMVQGHYMAEDHIFPIGRGARRSLASNDTSDGRKKNRRIEFTLSKVKPN
jgi:chemotaxis protein MotB